MRPIFILATSAWLISCSGDDVQTSNAPPATLSASGGSQRSDADWSTLAATPIYFGHQSVGRNILDGVRELNASQPAGPVRIAEGRAAGQSATPALVEFAIGENGDPESKLADFAKALGEMGDSAKGIAVFKYCYLDITPHTDVDSLFARHRDALRAMRARYPALTFVHVTAPLTTLEPTPKLLVKRLLGKPTARDANAKRNAFNARLRSEFAGEPIFDLARVESTRPDGSRAYFMTGSDTVFTLAPELTDDGGHLNAAGRRVAALEFLSVLTSTVTSTGLNARAGAQP